MKTFEEYQYRFSIPHNKVKSQYKYTPKTKDELIEAIEAEIELQGPNADLNCIDTSKITDMSYLFDVNKHEYARNFNGDISNWDVSNVANMHDTFWLAKSFNGDISTWNVNNVTNMSHMFYRAKSFNGDISGWDVSNVEYMRGMFWGAESFNQNISGWNTNNVNDKVNMFIRCPIKEEYKPKFN